MKQRKKSFGMRISAFVLSFAMVCTLLAGVNVVAFAADDDLVVSVHSFYNDATKGGDGEHLYTKDLDEMSWLSSLPTWNDEDEAWKAPVSSSLAVYRVYNPNSGEHHYAAADEAEWLVSQGWTQEKIAFYSDDNMGVPVYRLWNGGEGVGSHYYTTDEGEAAYLASIGWTAEGVNFYGVKEEEPGEKEMTAVQTGAREITVTSEAEFTGLEEFAVSHGLIEDTVEDLTVIDDNTVILTLDSDIIEAEYMVECSDEEYEPATFYGEKAIVFDIVFPSDALVLNADQQSGSAAYATVDQWGDPIKDPTAKFSVPAGYQINNVWDEDNQVGIVTIAKTPAAIIVEGTQVPVSVIYANNTGVENVVLTASASSVVDDMVVGELVPLSEELEDLRVTNERIAGTNLNFNYALPVIAKDQYGRSLSYQELNNMVENQQLFITPLSGVVSVGAFFEDPTTGIILLPVYGNGEKYGAETVNFLARSGFSTTADILVQPMEVIDSIDVVVGDLQVDKPVPFAFLATDQYGDIVDVTDTEMYTITPTLGNPSNTIVITRKVQGHDTDFVATIHATYGSTFALTTEGFTLTASEQAGATQQETLAIKTATNKMSLPTVKVNAAATPAYVKDFAVDNVLSYDNMDINITNVTSAAKYVIIDSYGEVMSAQDFEDGGYTLEVTEAGTHTYTQLNAAGTTIELKDVGDKVPTSPVNETYKVTIKKGGTEVSARNVTVTVAGKITSYMAGFASAAELPKSNLYVGAAGADAAFLGLYGFDSQGNMIALDTDDYSVELVDDTVAGATLELDGFKLTCTSASAIQTTVAEDAVVEIYDQATGKLLTSATIQCSNEAPQAVSFVGTKDEEFVDLEDGVVTISGAPAQLSTEGAVTVGQIEIVAVDQYGRPAVIDKATLGGKLLTDATTIPDTFAGQVVTLNVVSGSLTDKIDVMVAQ